jgi:integrase
MLRGGITWQQFGSNAAVTLELRMAGYQNRQGSYRIFFRYHGKQYGFSLGEVPEDEARTKASQVDYLLLRIKQRFVAVPPGVSIVDFMQFDGKVENTVPVVEKITFDKLKDKYLATHESSLELSTIKGIKQHCGHLVSHLGTKFPIGELSLADLQGYVDKRAKAKGRNGRKLSPATILKEIVTLRTMWNWAVKMKFVTGRFPNDGIRFPKATEKPVFQTRTEIERQIKTAKLSPAEHSDLWHSLYLTVTETTELLEYVQTTAYQPFIFPLFAFVAHTGCRRSEAIRAKIADVDFESGFVTIHEKKRVRHTLTTRRVPLSAYLTQVLKSWIAIHPGGESLFCQSPKVTRSKTRKGEIKPLTNDEAADHFDRTLQNSKWSVLKGWHLLRHSFISALANNGTDQRIIDDFVGHCTETQRRRYRHLYPSVKQNAIQAVFG